jgi:hypothetical protein
MRWQVTAYADQSVSALYEALAIRPLVIFV